MLWLSPKDRDLVALEYSLNNFKTPRWFECVGSMKDVDLDRDQLNGLALTEGAS